VVISDTHFGLSSSTLNDPALVDLFMEEISQCRNGCDEIVLLGDIFDFWRVQPEKAVRDSIYFLRMLSRMDVKIRYVVGNHDHHLVVQKQDDESMERMARGDLYPVYVPSLRWPQTLNRLNIEMFYPTYRMRCCHRNILLTHGHHLSGIQTVTMGMVETLRKLSGEDQRPADLEMMMTHSYESIYRSACIEEIVDFEELLWKASLTLQRFKAGVLRNQRSKPVEKQYDAILKFIRDQNLGDIDCFIYGDTHRAGIYQRKGGPLALNVGCFMQEQEEVYTLETPNTYLLLDEEGLTLRQLGRPEHLYQCELI
jgi:UDP-2,3-diacylglucosamine pyrophosphatase LpxH